MTCSLSRLRVNAGREGLCLHCELLVAEGRMSCCIGSPCSTAEISKENAAHLTPPPLLQITKTQLAAGQTLTVTLLPRTSPAARGVRIVPDWTTGVDPIFLGYNKKQGQFLSSTFLNDAIVSDHADEPTLQPVNSTFCLQLHRVPPLWDPAATDCQCAAASTGYVPINTTQGCGLSPPVPCPYCGSCELTVKCWHAPCSPRRTAGERLRLQNQHLPGRHHQPVRRLGKHLG